ncbi:MAG: hypothetical protein AB1568_16975 [Thermodesulfobacteriota bacterium]
MAIQLASRCIHPAAPAHGNSVVLGGEAAAAFCDSISAELTVRAGLEFPSCPHLISGPASRSVEKFADQHIFLCESMEQPTPIIIPNIRITDSNHNEKLSPQIMAAGISI